MGLAVWSTANNNYLYNNTGVGLGGSGGLYIGVSSNNTLISNRGICTDYIGIIVEDSSNCFLDSNTGISQAGSNRGLYIGISANITVVNQTATGSRGIQLTSANNTIIKDCVSINGTTYDVHVDATSLNNSFINCSYNTTEEYVESGSQLIRKWYFDALVTNLTNSPLVNSNLTIYNRTSSAVYSNLTNSTGHIYRAEVIDYTNVGGTRVYQTNHTVNVTKLGYYPNSTTYNVTNYTNIFATIKLNKNPLELIDCWTLSASGETYNLSMNVNSSGTCFTVTGQNIVLDCLGYSINYSTGGAAYTYGVYSDQYNTTIRNCTIIDGNTTSSNNNRYGIYLKVMIFQLFTTILLIRAIQMQCGYIMGLILITYQEIGCIVALEAELFFIHH
jgi:parallel beta-helix repeat protein